MNNKRLLTIPGVQRVHWLSHQTATVQHTMDSFALGGPVQLILRLFSYNLRCCSLQSSLHQCFLASDFVPCSSSALLQLLLKTALLALRMAVAHIHKATTALALQ